MKNNIAGDSDDDDGDDDDDDDDDDDGCRSSLHAQLQMLQF